MAELAGDVEVIVADVVAVPHVVEDGLADAAEVLAHDGDERRLGRLVELRQAQDDLLGVIELLVAVDADPVGLADVAQLLGLLGARGHLGHADVLEDLPVESLQVEALLDDPHGDALGDAHHELLGAAAGGDDARTDFDEPHVGLGRGLALGPVHGDLAAAAQGHAGRRRHDGPLAELQAHVGLLEVVDHLLEDVPVALLDGDEHLEDVGPDGEVGGLVADDEAREVLLHDVAGQEKHVDDVLVDGVHLGVELEAGHPVAHVDEAGARVLADDLLALLEGRQDDDPGVLGELHVVLLREVVVVGAVLLLRVEGGEPALEHLLDLLGHLLAELLHDLDGLLDADGVPGLEGPELVVVAPLHGVVDLHDGVRDLGDAVGGVDEVVAEVLADELRRGVLAVEDHLDGLFDGRLGLLGRADGLVLGLVGRHVLQGLDVDGELDLLALGVLGLLVEPSLGLVAQPLLLDHGLDEVGRDEEVAALVLGQGLVEVRHDVVGRVEAHEVDRPEDGGAGPPQGRADDGVDVLDPHALGEHEVHGVGHVVDADAVGDEVRDVLADDDALAEHVLAEAGHVLDDLLLRLLAGDDLDELHVPRRVEEVDPQEPLLEGLAQVGRDLADPDARGVGGHDAVGLHDLFHPGEEVLLDLEILDDGLDHQVHAREPPEVVLEVAGLDHRGVALRVEARRPGLRRALEPPHGEAVSPGRAFLRPSLRLVRLGQLGGHDVEQQALNPRIGQLGRDVRAHDPRA